MRPKPTLTEHSVRFTIGQLLRVWRANGWSSHYDRAASGWPSKRRLRRELGRVRAEQTPPCTPPAASAV